jgi:hypothetical protein
VKVERATSRWELLVQCLALEHAASLDAMREIVERAAASGAVPFEVIAGTPRARYGARLTFRPGADPRPLAAAFGFADHPWGVPAWVGVRVYPDGTTHAKAYHRVGRFDDRFALPAAMPRGFRPVMASLDGGATELYLRFAPACAWSTFVAACTASLAASAYTFVPHPRPAEYGYCLSVRWQAKELTAISLFADERCLPDDATVRRAWSQGMDDAERSAYETALAGVRSLGARGRNAWHALLGWTFERGGGWHRAASLRIPPTARSMACSS